MRIPEQGWSKQQVIETLERFRAGDMPWRDGRTWAYVYDPGPEAEEVIKQAFTMYLSENALDPTVFPSTLRMENELVAMAAAHLSGDEQVVGNFTSGGTESIILAVKTARDRARAVQPEIREPEIVLPTTAHACVPQGRALSGRERWCWRTPIRRPSRPTSRRCAPRSRRTRSCWSARPSRTRTASSIRSRSWASSRSRTSLLLPRRRLHGRLPAALLPARWARRCRASTSTCRASPRSRWTSTSTPSRPRARR